MLLNLGYVQLELEWSDLRMSVLSCSRKLYSVKICCSLNSSFLSALRTSQVYHNSLTHSLKHESTVFCFIPRYSDPLTITTPDPCTLNGWLWQKINTMRFYVLYTISELFFFELFDANLEVLLLYWLPYIVVTSSTLSSIWWFLLFFSMSASKFVRRNNMLIGLSVEFLTSPLMPYSKIRWFMNNMDG